MVVVHHKPIEIGRTFYIHVEALVSVIYMLPRFTNGINQKIKCHISDTIFQNKMTLKKCPKKFFLGRNCLRFQELYIRFGKSDTKLQLRTIIAGYLRNRNLFSMSINKN